MKTSILSVAMLALPALAAAQTPVPPTMPVPPVVPMAPVLAQPAIVIPDLIEPYAYLSAQDAERIRAAAEQARAKMDAMRLDQNEIREKAFEASREAMEKLRMAQPLMGDFKFADARTVEQAFAQTFSSDNERSLYDRGQNALSARQYEQAVMRFDQVIGLKGTRADGALYWKAYAQYKLGKSSDATATLAELSRNYKESKYLSDAKVLEAEVKKSAGQPARPENEDNEDLKLLAIQSLQNTDPERAIPLLQGVINSASSPKLKERAIYVLALSNQPQAHTMLVNIAKSGNPDLQMQAIRYLSMNRFGRDQKSPTTGAELADIYNNTQNDDVKRAILRAYGSIGDRDSLVHVLSVAGNGDLIRREALNQLSAAQAGPELWSIYQKETNKEFKMQILSSLGSMGAYDKVIEVAKTEKDADIRRRAIRSLGNMRAERSGQALTEVYNASSDLDDKKAALQGLANQNNADAIIGIARKESNFELKRKAVEYLTSSSMAKNKAVQDFLMEIIK